MRWVKLGQLYSPEVHGRHPKLLSHAANPLPVHLEGDVYRIYYSGRDERNRSSVGAVDVDIIRRQIIQDHELPFFVHGMDGSFYADGVSIGNCYKVQGKHYMLFMGWQSLPGSHWRGDIGRLEVLKDLTLVLDGTGPLMTSNKTDPVSLSYPWVEVDSAGYFRMWYGSTITWDAGNGEMLHVINQATSFDGNQWDRHGLAIPYELGVAQAFSRPTIARGVGNKIEMWFSYRSGSGSQYRIGYATSADGRNWRLALDEAGIDVSTQGWDSEMIEYPFVFDHEGQRYLLYNGNSHGKTGFGLAVQSFD